MKRYIKSYIDDVTTLNQLSTQYTIEDILELWGFTLDTDSIPNIYAVVLRDSAFIIYNPNQKHFYCVRKLTKDELSSAYSDLVYDAFSKSDFQSKYPYSDIEDFTIAQFMEIMLDYDD